MKKPMFISIAITVVLFLLAVAYRHSKKPYNKPVSFTYQKSHSLIIFPTGSISSDDNYSSIQIVRQGKVVAKMAGDSVHIYDCNGTILTLMEGLKQNQK